MRHVLRSDVLEPHAATVIMSSATVTSCCDCSWDGNDWRLMSSRPCTVIAFAGHGCSPSVDGPGSPGNRSSLKRCSTDAVAVVVVTVVVGVIVVEQTMMLKNKIATVIKIYSKHVKW